jgi:hypothetical protein
MLMAEVVILARKATMIVVLGIVVKQYYIGSTVP